MDTKTNPYIPDSKSRKEKILVALSGNPESYVTAYLLKIQHYELMAVTVVNSWDDGGVDQDLVLSCHLNEKKIDEIKSFCQKMGISHKVIKNSSEFTETVIGPWVGKKILGLKSNPCWDCHAIRMKTLHKAFKESDAKYLATGHYAKVFKNDAEGTVFVHTSNDEEHDQSIALSRLPDTLLKVLLLPLSDLSKKEVLKLAENFGVIGPETSLKNQECLTLTDSVKEYFEKKIPRKYLGDGEILSDDTSVKQGEHKGLFTKNYGEEIDPSTQKRSERSFVSKFLVKDKVILTRSEEYFLRSRIVLKNCIFSQKVNWSAPQKGVLVINHETLVEAWFHPKTLDSIYIELEAPQHLLEGDILGGIKKRGKNNKVFFTGEVRFLPEEVIDEGEGRVSKIDDTTDF